MSDVVEDLRTSYERCKYWPEKTEDGMRGLLEMRNAGIRAAAEIERLRAAISDAASLMDGHEQWGAERLLIANQLRATLSE